MGKILEFTAVAIGMAMSSSCFVQAHKIYKNKSAKDISLIFCAMFSFGTLVWLAFGIYRKDWVVVVTYIVGAISWWSVFLLALKYRNQK